MNKPNILVTPQQPDNDINTQMYLDSIIKAGGNPILIPLKIEDQELKKMIEEASGIMFTGGADVHPSLYNEEDEYCYDFSIQRDVLELKCFQYAYQKELPILAICRGFQLINVLLGGTLYQDLETQFSDMITHRMEKPYDRMAHTVSIDENSRLYQIVKTNELEVNSCHHQGIKNLANGLHKTAESEDGLIEAYEKNNYPFLIGFQWHPERLINVSEEELEIFKAFIQACEE